MLRWEIEWGLWDGKCYKSSISPGCILVWRRKYPKYLRWISSKSFALTTHRHTHYYTRQKTIQKWIILQIRWMPSKHNKFTTLQLYYTMQGTSYFLCYTVVGKHQTRHSGKHTQCGLKRNICVRNTTQLRHRHRVWGRNVYATSEENRNWVASRKTLSKRLLLPPKPV